VRTVYRQARRAAYGRYIVTTTGAWGEPRRSARFEIRLPAGARPLRFSHLLRGQTAGGRICYLFQASDFLPDRDIVFEWSEARSE
jgi:hypothetical protein